MAKRTGFFCLLLLLTAFSYADEQLQNRGNDPFFQISKAIPNCPEPAGPRTTEAEWIRESHHRIEHGNHCWIEGRCRLPNAFAYDQEIADSTRRRLQWLSANMPAWEQSTLWITVWQRWVLIQGCVGPQFPTAKFMEAMREVPDAERVVDQTTRDASRNVPYERFTKAPAPSTTPRPPPQTPSAPAHTSPPPPATTVPSSHSRSQK